MLEARWAFGGGVGGTDVGATLMSVSCIRRVQYDSSSFFKLRCNTSEFTAAASSLFRRSNPVASTEVLAAPNKSNALSKGKRMVQDRSL